MRKPTRIFCGRGDPAVPCTIIMAELLARGFSRGPADTPGTIRAEWGSLDRNLILGLLPFELFPGPIPEDIGFAHVAIDYRPTPGPIPAWRLSVSASEIFLPEKVVPVLAAALEAAAARLAEHRLITTDSELFDGFERPETVPLPSSEP